MEYIEFDITTEDNKTKIKLLRESITYVKLYETIRELLQYKEDFSLFVKGKDNTQCIKITDGNIEEYITGIEDSISLLTLKNSLPISDINHIYNDICQSDHNTISTHNWNDKEICCICENKIEEYKFSCCICDGNIIFCKKCELKHAHPLIKYKTKFLAKNIDEVYDYVSLFANKKEFKSGNPFTKPIEFLPSQTFPLNIKVNKQHNLPINIIWNNRHTGNRFLVIKNYDDLTLTYNYTVESTEAKPIKTSQLILSVTGDKIGKSYEILVYFYRSEEKTASHAITISLNITDNPEDDELYELFRFYSSYLYLPTGKKKIMKKLQQNRKFSNKSFDEIYKRLEEVKWNLTLA